MEQRVRDLETQLEEALRTHTGGIALPAKFDDGDLTSWLEMFTVCATANRWNPEAQLRRLPTLLTGRAIAIYQRLRDGD